MKTPLVLTSLILAATWAVPAHAADYQVKTSYAIGGKGNWDYVTVDPEHKLLFVPRTTHTLVVGEDTGKVIADIPGQKRNHGVALVPNAGRGFISDGGDGSIVVFDLKTYAVLGKIKAEQDADGIIYDAASNKVLCVSGDGGVLMPLSPDVDPQNGKLDREVDLGGSPEFLAADGRGEAFININDKDNVAVVDLKSMAVIHHWSTAPGGRPVGMSMDREHRRLFIGCRNPQKMIVMDADTGKVLADLPIGVGVDATVFDPDLGNGLASCFDGTLTVVHESGPEAFAVAQVVKTHLGARTMTLDPTTHAIYLPTAEFKKVEGAKRPAAKPDSFMVLVVAPGT